jgi:hypothetical protein
MSRKQVLLDGVEATDATKRSFELTRQDFQGNSLPTLKVSGLDTSDSVKVYEDINGGWSAAVQTLDDSSDPPSVTFASVGVYAIDVTRTTGTISAQLDSTGTAR